MTLVISKKYTTWAPDLISTSLWLDAADASTVTTVSGAVSQWDDKSGNGRNATQATAANRPLYTAAAQNSLSALSFDGSNDYLGIASASIFTANTGDFALFAAYKSKFTSGLGTLFSNFNAGGNFVLYFGTSPAYTTPWGVSNGSSLDMDSGSHTTNKNYLISLVRSASNFTGWTDGNQKNTVSNGINVGVPTPWNIGRIPNESFAFMDLYELITINSAPSTLNRQKLEGYLAHKWNLTADLPSDHPFKWSKPPV